MSDESPLGASWTALGLDRTARLVAPHATLRGDTVVLSDAATRDAPPAAAEPPAKSAATLPRISIRYADADTSVPAPTDADLVVDELLGEGGMGRVYLAKQRSLARDVAVKTSKAGTSNAALAALLAEGTVTGQLEHPGIIPVHALGLDHRGRPLLIMKRIEGVEWRALIYDDEHPEWSGWLEADRDQLDAHLEILGRVCDALHFAHSRGVFHRDVKPENVMLGRFGEVYLVDWGVAHREGDPRSGCPVGSPAYMAPEMVTAGDIDARSDVYLLGATLHEVLTQRVRHEGETVHAVLCSALLSEPVSYAPDVPAELAELCNRATAERPEDRPESALAFKEQLSAFRKHESSIRVCSSAEASLERALEADGTGADPDELLAESRFGFRQALDLWPGNERARTGLQRCAEARVRLDLEQGDAERARRHLEELNAPPPELERDLEALEQRLADERQRHEQLEQLERDFDPRYAARQRARMLVVLAFIGLAITAFAIANHFRQGSFGVINAVGIAVFLLVTLSITAWVGRRSLLRTGLNRRATMLLGVTLLGLLFGRLGSLRFEASVEQVLMRDMMLLAVACTIGGATLFRWLYIAAVANVIAFVVVMFAPQLTVLAFSVATTIAVTVPALFELRRKDALD